MFFIYLMAIEDEEERKSLEALYYKYRHQCMHMVRRYTDDKDEAEDMVQEVFVRIIKHKDEYLRLSESNFEALLVTIVKNLGIDDYRRRSRIVLASDTYEEQIISKTLPTDRKAILQDQLKSVMDEIHKYDEKTQLIMYYKSLLIPTKVIADMMEMPYKTVENKIYRVRKELKEKLNGDDFFD
ncbi:MAG: RNA polymerase sigma factor [Lachnospiraceae bacterium]|nr:RNA polymerase sigma factor [Lachnospiraceae bacterium]